MMDFYATADGTYAGQHDIAPEGCTAVPSAPPDASQVWNGAEWVSPEPTLAERIATIDAIYNPKFDQLRQDIGTVTLLDGPLMDDKVTALRAKYATTWDEYSAALIAAVSEGDA